MRLPYLASDFSFPFLVGVLLCIGNAQLFTDVCGKFASEYKIPPRNSDEFKKLLNSCHTCTNEMKKREFFNVAGLEKLLHSSNEPELSSACLIVLSLAASTSLAFFEDQLGNIELASKKALEWTQHDLQQDLTRNLRCGRCDISRDKLLKALSPYLANKYSKFNVGFAFVCLRSTAVDPFILVEKASPSFLKHAFKFAFHELLCQCWKQPVTSLAQAEDLLKVAFSNNYERLQKYHSAKDGAEQAAILQEINVEKENALKVGKEEIYRFLKSKNSDAPYPLLRMILSRYSCDPWLAYMVVKNALFIYAALTFQAGSLSPETEKFLVEDEEGTIFLNHFAKRTTSLSVGAQRNVQIQLLDEALTHPVQDTYALLLVLYDCWDKKIVSPPDIHFAISLERVSEVLSQLRLKAIRLPKYECDPEAKWHWPFPYFYLLKMKLDLPELQPVENFPHPLDQFFSSPGTIDLSLDYLNDLLDTGSHLFLPTNQDFVRQVLSQLVLVPSVLFHCTVVKKRHIPLLNEAFLQLFLDATEKENYKTLLFILETGLGFSHLQAQRSALCLDWVLKPFEEAAQNRGDRSKITKQHFDRMTQLIRSLTFCKGTDSEFHRLLDAVFVKRSAPLKGDCPNDATEIATKLPFSLKDKFVVGGIFKINPATTSVFDIYELCLFLKSSFFSEPTPMQVANVELLWFVLIYAEAYPELATVSKGFSLRLYSWLIKNSKTTTVLILKSCNAVVNWLARFSPLIDNSSSADNTIKDILSSDIFEKF